MPPPCGQPIQRWWCRAAAAPWQALLLVPSSPGGAAASQPPPTTVSSPRRVPLSQTLPAGSPDQALSGKLYFVSCVHNLMVDWLLLLTGVSGASPPCHDLLTVPPRFCKNVWRENWGLFLIILFSFLHYSSLVCPPAESPSLLTVINPCQRKSPSHE